MRSWLHHLVNEVQKVEPFGAAKHTKNKEMRVDAALYTSSVCHAQNLLVDTMCLDAYKKSVFLYFD